MTPAIERLKELEAKATRGPWICGLIREGIIWRTRPKGWPESLQKDVHPKADSCELCKEGCPLLSAEEVPEKDGDGANFTKHLHIYLAPNRIASAGAAKDVIAIESIDYGFDDVSGEPDDFNLIAALRNAAPALLNALEALHTETMRWRVESNAHQRYEAAGVMNNTDSALAALGKAVGE